MKKYQKNKMPFLYERWFNENNERLQKKDLTEEELFGKITKHLKSILRSELLKEQGHICAYCGKRIGIILKSEKITFSIDHFEPKFCNRDLTLAYSNFIGTCKLSMCESDVIKLADIQTIPKTFQSIALEKKINITDITGRGKIKEDEDLELHGIQEIKYRNIPLHCDDTKENQLKEIGWKSMPEPESVEYYLLNPLKDDCETFFEYEEDGTISPNMEKTTTEIFKAKNTITVFNLNNKHLLKERANAYQTAHQLLESDLREDITIDEIYKNKKEDEQLRPYCFVTAYVWKKYY